MSVSPLLLQIDAAVCGARAATASEPAVAADPLCVALLQLTRGRVPLVARIAGAVLTPALKILVIVIAAYIANRLMRRVITRFARTLAQKGLRRFESLSARAPLADTSPLDLQRAALRAETVAGTLRSLSSVVVWAIAVMMILGVFDISLGPLIAGAGIVGVALGFGSQSLVKDFLSGVFMLLEDQYGVGDVIDTGEATGVVEAVTLRTTRVRDVHGTVWYVPNGEIRRVGNKTQQWARIVLDLGVAYHTDVAQACAVLKRVADALWQDEIWGPLVIEEPEIWGVERFDADQLTIRMVLKVQPSEQWRIGREVRARIKQAFDEAGIEIPFPQRSVWIRSEPSEKERVDARPDGRVNTRETSE